jgi:ABC-type phosphate/phosphonate transport system substrate-binding protein
VRTHPPSTATRRGSVLLAMLAGIVLQGSGAVQAAATYRSDATGDVSYTGSITRSYADDIVSVYADKSVDRLYVGLKDRRFDSTLPNRAVIASKITLKDTGRRYQIGRTPSGSLIMLLYTSHNNTYTRVSCSGMRFASTSYNGTHGFSFPRSCLKTAGGSTFRGTVLVGADQQRRTQSGSARDVANYLLSYTV